MCAHSQKGFALTEALVAAAISAGVFAAAVSLLAGVSRLAARANQLNAVAEEAQLISTRLDGGFDESQLLEGLNDWRLDRSPYRIPNDSLGSAGLQLARYEFTRTDDPSVLFERIAARGPE